MENIVLAVPLTLAAFMAAKWVFEKGKLMKWILIVVVLALFSGVAFAEQQPWDWRKHQEESKKFAEEQKAKSQAIKDSNRAKEAQDAQMRANKRAGLMPQKTYRLDKWGNKTGEMWITFPNGKTCKADYSGQPTTNCYKTER
jgi:hypothetical protein